MSLPTYVQHPWVRFGKTIIIVNGGPDFQIIVTNVRGNVLSNFLWELCILLNLTIKYVPQYKFVYDNSLALKILTVTM